MPLSRPTTGNKPVFQEMTSFETFFPSKNTSFNVGVVYNQGQIYSRGFDVTFNDGNGNKDHTHQLTFGISERGIAAILDQHQDGHGLRLLSGLAPTQIEVIPVTNDEATLRL
ncbi:hypothetical protein GF367_03370 [Candidatus Woesearchaeota archaeon]|nr:hypothetical protein [Candidatus Woesearchaeota archaeon]